MGGTYLSTEGGHISPHEAVGVPGNGLGIDVLVEFHVAGMDAEDLQTPGGGGWVGGWVGGLSVYTS